MRLMILLLISSLWCCTPPCHEPVIVQDLFVSKENGKEKYEFISFFYINRRTSEGYLVTVTVFEAQLNKKIKMGDTLMYCETIKHLK